MAKTAKKKAKSAKKSARMTAKPKAVARSAKPARKPQARKAAAPKIDPLNRKNYHSVTPMLSVSDVRGAINFYTNVFGFTAQQVMDTPYGIMHAELVLRDTKLMLSPEERQQNNLSAKSVGNTPVTLFLLVEDVDAIVAGAVAAGGKVLMPVDDMFWGDRCGVIADPEGNKWMIATHKSEPTEAEMAESMQRSMRERAPQAAAAAAGSGY